jgi:hypothetical protein
MRVSFSLKSEDQYPVEVGWLNPYDELHRHVDCWNFKFTAFLWWTSFWVQVPSYHNYIELVMITTTGITQTVSQYHMAKLNLFFLSKIVTFIVPG